MNFAIKETAELLRLKLLLGLVTVQDVVTWADSIIESEATPDWEIIEVSLARTVKVDEMMKLLTDIKGNCVRAQVFRRLFQTWLIGLSEDTLQGKTIARQLYMLADELKECGFGSAAYALDDAFDLIEFGYCTHEQALQQLQGYLQEFAESEISDPAAHPIHPELKRAPP
ncbi:MAG: hypothetical protein RL095_525 [Verrucomicrobiota bacterium]|jgi:hypothetical protein